MELLTNIPSLVTILTLDVLGLFAIIGLFEKGRRDQMKQKDEQIEILIQTMKDRIDLLSTEVKEAKDEAKGATVKFEKMKSENDTLIKVLQGRDETMQKFIADGFGAMRLGAQTHDLAVQNNGYLKKLAESMAELNKALAKHYKNISAI